MPHQYTADQILNILDQCNAAFRFPMLDNGYLYLAATRLCLFRSSKDWALTIEVFGFSPRVGIPDTQIYTFASKLCNRLEPNDFKNQAAYEKHLADHPYDESRFALPIEEGTWQDDEDAQFIANNAQSLQVRDQTIALPQDTDYHHYGIELENPPAVRVFELCRFLAETKRDLVLATESERRCCVPLELEQILQLESWSHPDIAHDTSQPSSSETFQQLAHVLSTGNLDLYQPTVMPNTHWKHWPNAGQL